MTPVVYIDMLFLLNLLMNSLTLYSTSLLLKRRVSVFRLLLTAAILAIYSCAMFFPNIVFLYSVIGKAVILTLATAIAFPTTIWGQLLKNTLVFFTVSGIFGGIIFALIFATDFGTAVGAAVSNGEIYLEINPSAIIFALLLSYLCIYVVSYIKKQAEIKKPNMATVEIQLFERKVKIHAFCDTGCGLTDPLTGYPAIIISPDAAKKLLPRRIFNSLKDGAEISDLDNFLPRYRVLPFSTIACKNDILHGFLPDMVFINRKNLQKCVVAISNNPLCNNAEFDAIFNPSILDIDTDLSKNATPIYERT